MTVGNSDVFFGPTGDFYRVTWNAGVDPYWEYELEGNNSRWKPSVTAKITIHPDAALTSGTYLIKVVIPNGISDELIYTVE